MKRLVLNEMTWPQVKEKLDKIKIVLIPVGSCEQHGPNTSFATDTARAEGFCKLLAERMGDRVLVAPAVAYGISPHHMHFPGTVTLRVETMLNLLTDIVVSLHKHGFDRFIFLNGHGGNRPILDAACVKLRYEYGLKAYWSSVGTPVVREQLKELELFDFSTIMGHACEAETSQLMYLAPQYVSKTLEKGSVRENGLFAKKLFKDGGAALDWYEDASENGALGDARNASSEKGRIMTDLALAYTENLINELLSD